MQVRVRVTPSTTWMWETTSRPSWSRPEAWDPGDDVVGASDVLGHLHTIKITERLGDMGDLADLGLDEHVRAQHPALASSAVDLSIPA